MRLNNRYRKMKKTAILITIILNLICLCACSQQTGTGETEVVEVMMKLEELLPKEVPDKMVFWFCNEEYIIADAEVLERLWGKLLGMTAKEVTLRAAIEGVYCTDCYYGNEIVTIATTGDIINIDDAYYEVGDELFEWEMEQKKAAGMKFD